MTESDLKITPLHLIHEYHGAKMVQFAGFRMPVQYSGIIDEHFAVRNEAGLFDVSHMGEVMVTGESAFDYIQNLVSNDISSLYDGKALYTVMCNKNGGIIDDLLVYRINEFRYMLVINASNRETDIAWMMESRNAVQAKLTDVSDETGLLALQGPKSLDVLVAATGFDASTLKYYHFTMPTRDSFLGLDGVIISRTGYTGEIGFELYCRSSDTVTIWEALMDVSRSFGLKPVGLGARDTLRLESGFCLHGNEITDIHNPLEAGLGWLTKFDKGDFIGRDALLKIKSGGLQKRLIGFVANERGIPRQGYGLFDMEGNSIGEVTSGTQSPVLKKGIGMGYVSNRLEFTKSGSHIQVSARGKMFRVTVQKPPFHKQG